MGCSAPTACGVGERRAPDPTHGLTRGPSRYRSGHRIPKTTKDPGYQSPRSIRVTKASCRFFAPAYQCRSLADASDEGNLDVRWTFPVLSAPSLRRRPAARSDGAAGWVCGERWPVSGPVFPTRRAVRGEFAISLAEYRGSVPSTAFAPAFLLTSPPVPAIPWNPVPRLGLRALSEFRRLPPAADGRHWLIPCPLILWRLTRGPHRTLMTTRRKPPSPPSAPCPAGAGAPHPTRAALTRPVLGFGRDRSLGFGRAGRLHLLSPPC